MARLHRTSPLPAGVDLPEVMESSSWNAALAEVLTELGAGDVNDFVCTLTASGGLEIGGGGRSVAFSVEGADLEELDSVDITAEFGAALAPSGAQTVEAPSPLAARAAASRLEALLPALGAASYRDLPALLLEVALQVIPAESGCVLVHNPEAGTLTFEAASGPRSAGLLGQQIPDQAGIAGVVQSTGVGLTLRDARSMGQHLGSVDAQTGYRTRGILAVPLRGRLQGVLELLNPYGGGGFTSDHRVAADRIAAAAR